MIKRFGFLFCVLLFLACNDTPKDQNAVVSEQQPTKPELDLAQAQRLASLPLHCLQEEYPNKLNQVLNDSTHLASPKTLHPSFYGCFDWHSSVHGHWSLVFLLKKFPELENAALIRQKLAENMSAEHINAEVAYFKMKGNASYERTYGWAWVLKLAEELHTWNDPLAKELEANLQPLTDYMVQAYIEFLPRLGYPIRVGEHTNTAFGLSMAVDYAKTVGNEGLLTAIKETVDRFYKNDVACPLGWEPSGFDFLSPCLEEANLVRKVYGQDEFKAWLHKFLPQLTQADFSLEPGKVADRTDGKLVHLDGLNFSRAWCLYGISETLPEMGHLNDLAHEHINYSLPKIVDGNYGGTHWLGTFALYALNAQN
ncbi:DUF2891 domain-containing protein [Sediminicola luteus]|uniref:DUF2891 domain-containing protein n=1 Tax=Sediminicola luteus TaxID=319238 RepID=A0A2A4G7U5_9FLAO|nr:DUF2891 domain-containing protein [Sediminicola luteus]PCE64034.1 hypothetical protein B7P33_12370 [Sediminicola luteus]